MSLLNANFWNLHKSPTAPTLDILIEEGWGYTERGQVLHTDQTVKTPEGFMVEWGVKTKTPLYAISRKNFEILLDTIGDSLFDDNQRVSREGSKALDLMCHYAPLKSDSNAMCPLTGEKIPQKDFKTDSPLGEIYREMDLKQIGTIKVGLMSLKPDTSCLLRGADEIRASHINMKPRDFIERVKRDYKETTSFVDCFLASARTCSWLYYQLFRGVTPSTDHRIISRIAGEQTKLGWLSSKCSVVYVGEQAVMLIQSIRLNTRRESHRKVILSYEGYSKLFAGQVIKSRHFAGPEACMYTPCQGLGDCIIEREYYSILAN